MQPELDTGWLGSELLAKQTQIKLGPIYNWWDCNQSQISGHSIHIHAHKLIAAEGCAMSAQLDLCNLRGGAQHSYPFAQMICVELQSALFNQGPALDLCNRRGPAFIFMLLNYVAPAGCLLHVSVVQCRGLQQRRTLVQPKPFIWTCSVVIGWFESRLWGTTNISLKCFQKCNINDKTLREL